MRQFQQRRRLIGMTVAVILIFGALGYRLVDLQVLRSEELSALATEQSRRYYDKQARRGDIRDVRGIILASSDPVKTVCVDPVLLASRQLAMLRTNTLTASLRTNPLTALMPTNRLVAILLNQPDLMAQLSAQQTAVAQIIATNLRTTVPELVQKFQLVRRTPQGQLMFDTNGLPLLARYVVLQRNVSLGDWDQIHQVLTNRCALEMTNALRSKLALQKKKSKGRPPTLSYRERAIYGQIWRGAVFPEDDQLRVYPNHDLAAHVLGYTARQQYETNNQIISVLEGAEGIEHTLHSRLCGVQGWRLTSADGDRREIFDKRDQDVDSIPGLNVYLTLDARVQQIIQEEITEPFLKHSPKSISVVAVRPATGEILGLACLPTFDPTNAHGVVAEFRRNRVTTEVAEPGSTFKIVTVAAALNEGRVRLSDVFFCENGAYHYAGYVLHDHEHYPNLTVEEIIMKSSNIGTAKIAIERLGAPLTYRYITDFGFGTRTGLPLNGESPGILPQLSQWSAVSLSRIPIGQGVAATSLQTVMAMSSIANGGLLMRPTLVDHLEDDKGHVVARYRPQMIRRVITEAAAREMNEVLKTVVTKDGTAVKAQLDHYTVAGKTGTAQKVEDVVVQTSRGPVTHKQYSHTKYYASFIGYFPTDRPQVCIGVMLDEPLKTTGYYGGQVAAPIFKRIAERVGAYLKIQPDLSSESAGGPTGASAGLARLAQSGPNRGGSL